MDWDGLGWVGMDGDGVDWELKKSPWDSPGNGPSLATRCLSNSKGCVYASYVALKEAKSGRSPTKSGAEVTARAALKGKCRKPRTCWRDQDNALRCNQCKHSQYRKSYTSILLRMPWEDPLERL